MLDTILRLCFSNSADSVTYNNMNAQIRSPKGGNKLASIFHLGRAASNFHFNPDRGYTAVEDSVVFKLGYATKVINPGDPILMPRSHYEHLKDIVRRS